MCIENQRAGKIFIAKCSCCLQLFITPLANRRTKKIDLASSTLWYEFVSKNFSRLFLVSLFIIEHGFHTRPCMYIQLSNLVYPVPRIASNKSTPSISTGTWRHWSRGGLCANMDISHNRFLNAECVIWLMFAHSATRATQECDLDLHLNIRSSMLLWTARKKS